MKEFEGPFSQADDLRGRKRIDLGMILTLEQEQEPLETEILLHMDKNPHSYSAFKNFSEFSRAQESIITEEPLRKTNIAISFGPPAAGKSNLHNQWIMEQISHLTGEDNPESISTRLRIDEEELRVYTFTWADAIIAAQQLGVVPSDLQFGEWTEDHLSRISQLAGKAVTIAREGAKGMVGIEGNAVGLIGIDVPMSTATKLQFETGKSEIVGYDRFYSVSDQLMDNLETAASTFFVGVLPDASSQHRRLKERASLRSVETEEEKKQWARSTRTRVSKKDQAKAFAYFRERSASVYAATEIAKQMDQLMLYLADQGEITLTPEEQHLLEREISLINKEYLLTSPQVKRLQADKLELVSRELYPHMIKGLQLPQHQFFDGWNRDVDEVHFYPSLPEEHNLIHHIITVNPKLLLP